MNGYFNLILIYLTFKIAFIIQNGIGEASVLAQSTNENNTGIRLTNQFTIPKWNPAVMPKNHPLED